MNQVHVFFSALPLSVSCHLGRMTKAQLVLEYSQKENKRKNKRMNKLTFIKCFFMTVITRVWLFFFFLNPKPRNFVHYPKARQKNQRTLYNNLGFKFIWICMIQSSFPLYQMGHRQLLEQGRGIRNWVLHMNKPVEILSSLMFLLAGIRMAQRQPS